MRFPPTPDNEVGKGEEELQTHNSVHPLTLRHIEHGTSFLRNCYYVYMYILCTCITSFFNSVIFNSVHSTMAFLGNDTVGYILWCVVYEYYCHVEIMGDHTIVFLCVTVYINNGS